MFKTVSAKKLNFKIGFSHHLFQWRTIYKLVRLSSKINKPLSDLNMTCHFVSADVDLDPLRLV